jgi:hypothetical protein
VALELRFIDPPEVAGAILRYDLWLVQREADGREVTERVRTSGTQGFETPMFAPMHHRADGVLLGHQGAAWVR